MLIAALVMVSTIARADTLPKSVQGLWGHEPADCANDDSDGRLTIEPKMVLFFATGYDVTRVARRKDGTLKISGFVAEEGEAGRTRGRLTLKLLAPDRLQVDGGHVYHRCK